MSLPYSSVAVGVGPSGLTDERRPHPGVDTPGWINSALRAGLRNPSGYDPSPMGFPGGSAYTMVRDVAEGYLLVTERTFKMMTRPELEQLTFEIDRHLRKLRGDQPALEDLQ